MRRSHVLRITISPVNQAVLRHKRLTRAVNLKSDRAWFITGHFVAHKARNHSQADHFGSGWLLARIKILPSEPCHSNVSTVTKSKRRNRKTQRRSMVHSFMIALGPLRHADGPVCTEN